LLATSDLKTASDSTERALDEQEDRGTKVASPNAFMMNAFFATATAVALVPEVDQEVGLRPTMPQPASRARVPGLDEGASRERKRLVGVVARSSASFAQPTA
jgi:hypothetical protein